MSVIGIHTLLISSIVSLLRMATVEETEQIVNETSFFYFVELQLVDPKAMKSLQATVFVTLMQTSTILVVASPLIVIRAIYSNAHVMYVCATAIDKLACEREVPLLVALTEALMYVFVAVSTLELVLHYCALPVHWLKTRFRGLFYLILTLCLLVASVYISIVVMWITLGLLVSPAQFSSIVCSIYGLAAVCLRFRKREQLVLRRVDMSFEAQTTKMVERQNRLAGQNFSEPLLRRMIKQQIDKHLRRAGMSSQHIARKTLLIALAQGILVAFLQFGFNAFTNTRDLYFGLINLAITVLCLAAVDSAVNGHQDATVVRDRIVDIVAGARMDTEKELRFVMDQIELGVKMITAERARRRAEESSSEDEEELVRRHDEDMARKMEIMEKKRQKRNPYMMRKALAQQLVLGNGEGAGKLLQTFDSTRIWTRVQDDQLSDNMSWESASTKGTTVASSEGTRRPSSVTGSASRRSRSRRGSKASIRGTPSHHEAASSHSGGGGGTGATIPRGRSWGCPPTSRSRRQK